MFYPHYVNDLKHGGKTFPPSLTLHELGFIHHDFRKWNLLKDQDQIVDWGFAVEVNQSVLFSGSLETLRYDINRKSVV